MTWRYARDKLAIILSEIKSDALGIYRGIGQGFRPLLLSPARLMLSPSAAAMRE